MILVLKQAFNITSNVRIDKSYGAETECLKCHLNKAVYPDDTPESMPV